MHELGITHSNIITNRYMNFRNHFLRKDKYVNRKDGVIVCGIETIHYNFEAYYFTRPSNCNLAHCHTKNYVDVTASVIIAAHFQLSENILIFTVRFKHKTLLSITSTTEC